MDTNAFSNTPPRLDIDPHTLPIEALEDEITTLSASIAVATWRLLMLIAELDRRGKWGSWGLASCAHWLNWKCGIALGAAREKVRVAHALAGLPRVRDALARGVLSYSKARATAPPHMSRSWCAPIAASTACTKPQGPIVTTRSAPCSGATRTTAPC